MISIAQPIAAGNAIRLFIEPPSGSLKWRILRKGADTFTDQDDANALVTFEGDDKVFIDTEALQNDVPAFYKPYYFNGAAWSTAGAVSATPRATYQDCSTDALDIVCDRIREGLAVEVQRGNFHSELGYISVYTAPPSMEKDIRFPVVTVTLDHEVPNGRALGEILMDDEFDDDSSYFESEGWLANVQISVVGWSLNPNERRDLRKALRRIVVANLPVFADAGMQQVELSQADSDAVSGEYGAPIYQAVCTFSCLSPVRVGNSTSVVTDVEVRGNSNV
jgi:hypothetical protein